MFQNRLSTWWCNAPIFIISQIPEEGPLKVNQAKIFRLIWKIKARSTKLSPPNYLDFVCRMLSDHLKFSDYDENPGYENKKYINRLKLSFSI